MSPLYFWLVSCSVTYFAGVGVETFIRHCTTADTRWPSMPPCVVYSIQRLVQSVTDGGPSLHCPAVCAEADTLVLALCSMGWVGWVGGGPAVTPHILHRAGKVRDEGPSGWRGRTEPLSLFLLWGMIGVWSQRGGSPGWCLHRVYSATGMANFVFSLSSLSSPQP